MRDDEAMTTSTTTPRRRAAALAAAVVLASAAGAGCGSASAPSPPSGVDGLVIPTPDPDPADFVAEVDNPWFPLPVGARWEYDDDTATAGPSLEVTAASGPRIAGVRTTTRVRTPAAGAAVRDHFAQDRDGNVWWFGREGEWRAGEDGAEAGLAMPATPRVGDGFRPALTADLARATATVEDLGLTVAVPLSSYDDTVVLEVSDGLLARTEVYARGVGLVRTDETGLVAYDEPRP